MATLRNIAIGLIGARPLGRRTENLLSLLDHKRVTPVTGASTLN